MKMQMRTSDRTCSAALRPHLGDDLRQGAAGLVADPHFVLGALGGADGLELAVDRLVGERLDAQLRLAGRVQLQVVSQRRV